MQPITGHVAAVLLGLLLALLPSHHGLAAPETSSPPEAVMEAITESPAPSSPEQVLVGAYINDIQQIDFKTNNYIIDLYVWFRWMDPELDPSKTMEFMNCFGRQSARGSLRRAAENARRESLRHRPLSGPVLDQVLSRELSLRYAKPESGDGRHCLRRRQADLRA